MEYKKSEARSTGIEGERIAAGYLAGQGYKLLDANYRYRHREIDLIVEKAGVLAFVEVKTRSADALQSAPCAVDWRKQMYLYSAAAAYVRNHGLVSEIRFDIVWIERRGKGKYVVVEHVENAFSPLGG